MIKNLTKNARKPKGLWGHLMISKMNAGHGPLTEWALELLDVRPSDRALDIGCGGGQAVRRLCARMPGGRVYGVDYSPLAVKRAIRVNRTAIAHGRAEILQSGVSQLPFPDDSFQLAIAIETVYFWPNLEEDLREIHRVLDRGGQMAIVCEMVQMEGELPTKYEEVAEFLKMRIPSPEGLEETLRRAGYHQVRSWQRPEQGWLCVIGEK